MLMALTVASSRPGLPAHDLSLQTFIERQLSLTTVFPSTISDLNFKVTNVHAPSDHRDSRHFLEEMSYLASSIDGSWLITGDFNMLRSA